MESFELKYMELRKKYKKAIENRRNWVAYARAASKSLRRKRRRLQKLERLLRQRREMAHQECTLRRIYFSQPRAKK